ncbi:MAG TPA: hypothetical protein VGU63_12860 [Candidatus Acidoferrales bacterium]|nr:hypothetical protein [Candidatus Acidoferrales bacterium]
MKTTKPMLDYLATCSQTSLESFQLARLNDLANLRKQMIEIVDQWVESDIQARIAEWILVRRRRQSPLRPPQSVRRMRSKQRPLPLIANSIDSLAQFPALSSNDVIPVLCSAVSSASAPAPGRALEAVAKSKRIA